MTAFSIGGRDVGTGCPVYIIAEMSGNHNHDYARAEAIVHAAKEAGADAVKLQTYTPDTITIDCDNEYFTIEGTPWEGRNLYSLYGEAFTPWSWQPKLKKLADSLGLDLFSSPFDSTAVDFLEEMHVDAYKIASFELVDLPLIRKVASTGKPTLMSTGMATESEIEEAVQTFHQAGGKGLILLKCTSAYPAPPEEANLFTIPDMAKQFKVSTGLSDHTTGSAVAVAAIGLGACVVEKHMTLSRADGGPDAAFSMEPDEFKQMVDDIRVAEAALGEPFYGRTPKQEKSIVFRRSLFVVEAVQKGQAFTEKNIRSIRPGMGMHTRHYEEVLGKIARKKIERGTPLSWDLIE